VLCHHPTDREDSSYEATVPGEAGAGEKKIQGRTKEVAPGFDDEKKSCSDEAADCRGDNHRRSQLVL
jgi:hypothetical protein